MDQAAAFNERIPFKIDLAAALNEQVLSKMEPAAALNEQNLSKMDPAAAMNEQLLSRMRVVLKTEEKGDSEIQQLFNGSVVFITGGTGFLGKQLIEKLLRACHGITKIYILTRSKKGKSMEERLTKIFKDPVFDQLRKISPEFNKTIVPVEGNISELKLGINDEDWKKLTAEVNFIYHVAATVLFNEPIKSAIIANVRGAREAITLARECHNLKSMVYVSTAYSHCNRKQVLEKFYPSPVPPVTMIEMVESMEKSRIDAMTPALTAGWPNTYTFSKAIAEETVRVMGEGLPICVVRPSIVVPSYREPEPGWLDLSNVFGVSGLVLACGLGVIKTQLVDDETQFDAVPVDYVNNLTIASSWETAKRFKKGEQEIKIYTLSRIRNRSTWRNVRAIIENEFWNFLSPKTVWYPAVITTANKNIYLFLTIMLHFIPALFIDAILKAVGQKIRIGKIYRKIYKMNTFLGHFALNTWDFYDDNTVDLCKKLSEPDKQIFQFDVANIDHNTFVVTWWLGLRKYIIKDSLKGTKKAVKRLPYMIVVHYIISALYIFFIWKMLVWFFVTFSFCYDSLLQWIR